MDTEINSGSEPSGPDSYSFSFSQPGFPLSLVFYLISPAAFFSQANSRAKQSLKKLFGFGRS